MRRSRVLALLLLALFVLVSMAWIGVESLNGEPLGENLMFTVLYATFAVIGWLIASRRPENSVGWIFLAIAIGANTGNGASAYAEYSLVTNPGSLPAGAWMAALGEALWPTAITSTLLLLVLFPSGRPSSRFQKWLLRGAIVGIASLGLGAFLLRPYRIHLSESVSVSNPFGVETLSPILKPLSFLAIIVPVVAFLSIGALIVQGRRSHGVERQQLKWFAYSALTMVLVNFVLVNIVRTLFPSAVVDENAGNIGFIVGFALIPLGTGVAILRYRLYDLERIINRTLVYGAVTAVLAACYLGLVVLLQTVLEPLTRESDLAVAGSTLGVAAIFRPLRSRLQSFIDHRFYRRKYNAGRTLEAFAGHLRNEVDLRSLERELVGVVSDTMQPTHASLWLRSEGPVRT